MNTQTTTPSASLCPEHGDQFRTWCVACVEAVERPDGARDQAREKRFDLWPETGRFETEPKR